MEAYFYTITKTNRQSGERIGKTVGVVAAESENEAEEKAWALAGSATAYGLKVDKIDLNEGFKFTVYKSEI